MNDSEPEERKARGKEIHCNALAEFRQIKRNAYAGGGRDWE